MRSSPHNRVHEVEGANTAGEARQRLREHRYADTLVLVRETLTNDLGYSDPRTGWIPTKFIHGSQHSRLTAAFDDASTLDLVDSVVERMAAADADVDADYERQRAELADYRTDLEAMTALRSAVNAAEGSVSVRELNSVSTRAKRRLAWLERAGAVHVISDIA